MIRITLDLLKYGNENNKSNLGYIEIANDGTGTEFSGNYNYKLYSKRGKKILLTGDIKNFARKRYDVFDLLYLVLSDALIYKKGVTII